MMVALRAGAWIETSCQRDRVCLVDESPSVRGRGLKQNILIAKDLNNVALRAGAWIETDSANDRVAAAEVALRAGAWIET